MTRLCFFLLLALSPFVKASTVSDTSVAKRFQIGISGGPSYSYRHLMKNKTSNDPYIHNVINSRNSSEIMNLGYSAGVDFLYLFKKKWIIKSGLSFDLYTYRTKKIYLTTTTPDPTVPSYIQNYYRTSIIELPLSVGYITGFKRIRFHFILGAGACYFIDKKSYMIGHYADGTNKKTSISYNIHENHFSLISQAAIGINYALTSRISVQLEPTFKYQVTPMNNDPILMRLYSLNGTCSLMIGL